MTRVTSTNAASSTKRKLAIICMASLVAFSGAFGASGCGVRMGMEKIDDAKQAKKQAEDVQDKVDRDLKKGPDY